jgi:hypothetical protein
MWDPGDPGSTYLFIDGPDGLATVQAQPQSETLARSRYRTRKCLLLYN